MEVEKAIKKSLKTQKMSVSEFVVTELSYNRYKWIILRNEKRIE